ncbi:PD-(D/E)XK nuclease family protein [bacterium]|nr:PD-(D/E)XK nuclease family protein [bacterium]
MANETHQNICLTGNRDTGKSGWLCDRYVQLILSGVPADKVLFIAQDEARARVISIRILQRIRGIWGTRITTVGGFLADFAREVLARQAHPIYPLRFVTPWQLYSHIKKQLPENQKPLTNYYISLFQDFRKWNLDAETLSQMSLSEYPASDWNDLLTLYKIFCSYITENNFSDLISLTHLFEREGKATEFLPSYLLVDDAHELNSITWRVVRRLCQASTFTLAMLPEGQLFDEVNDEQIKEIREKADEIQLGESHNEPLTFRGSIENLIEKENHPPSTWTLLRTASPFEEMLQGLLWARGLAEDNRVIILLTSPKTQLNILLEAAAWLDIDISLVGNFQSDCLSYDESLLNDGNETELQENIGKQIPAKWWRTTLHEKFRSCFECASDLIISSDASKFIFREAFEKGLLDCEFDPKVIYPNGIQVATFQRSDLVHGAYVWVPGLSRESFPGSVPKNPVFSNEATEELESQLLMLNRFTRLNLNRSMLSVYRDKKRKLLDILERAKRDVLLSYPLRASSEQVVAESPFFHSITEIARSTEKSSNIAIAEASYIQPISFIKTGCQQESTLRKPLQKRLEIFPLSPTALVEFIKCPRKFFYNQVLKLETPDRPIAMLTGLLLHEALAELLDPEKESKIPTGEDLEKWFQSFCRKSTTLSEYSEGMRYTIERFVIQVLRSFMQSNVWQGEIKSVETIFEQSLPDGLRLKGRIDRIDVTEEGLEVIDYKSHKSFGAKGLRSKFLEDEDWIQLPIYVKAVEALYKRPAAKASIIFFGFKRNDQPKRTSLEISNLSQSENSHNKSKPESVSSDELDETWKRVTDLAQDIFSETQSFGRGQDPPCAKYNSTCPFLPICPVASLSSAISD